MGQDAVHDETGLTFADLRVWREIEGEGGEIANMCNEGEKETADV